MIYFSFGNTALEKILIINHIGRCDSRSSRYPNSRVDVRNPDRLC